MATKKTKVKHHIRRTKKGSVPVKKHRRTINRRMGGRCKQCGKSMNPVDYMVNPVCLNCARENQRNVTGVRKRSSCEICGRDINVPVEEISGEKQMMFLEQADMRDRLGWEERLGSTDPNVCPTCRIESGMEDIRLHSRRRISPKEREEMLYGKGIIDPTSEQLNFMFTRGKRRRLTKKEREQLKDPFYVSDTPSQEELGFFFNPQKRKMLDPRPWNMIGVGLNEKELTPKEMAIAHEFGEIMASDWSVGIPGTSLEKATEELTTPEDLERWNGSGFDVSKKDILDFSKKLDKAFDEQNKEWMKYMEEESKRRRRSMVHRKSADYDYDRFDRERDELEGEIVSKLKNMNVTRIRDLLEEIDEKSD